MSAKTIQYKTLDLRTQFVCFPKLVKTIQQTDNIRSLKINQFSLKDEHDYITSDFSHGDTAADESYETRLMNDKYDFINFLNKLSTALPTFAQKLKEIVVVDIRKQEVEDNIWNAGYTVKCEESMNRIMHCRNKLSKSTTNSTERSENLFYGFYRENDSTKAEMPQVIIALISRYYYAWLSLTTLSFDHYIGSELVDWISSNSPQMQLLQLTKYWPSEIPNDSFTKLFRSCPRLTYLHLEQNYCHENKGYSVSLDDCKKINFKNFKGIKLDRTGHFLSSHRFSFYIHPRGEFKKLFADYVSKQEENFLEKQENQFHFADFTDVM